MQYRLNRVINDEFRIGEWWPYDEGVYLLRCKNFAELKIPFSVEFRGDKRCSTSDTDITRVNILESVAPSCGVEKLSLLRTKT